MLTFDDGYETFYRYVFPLLRDYKLPATNFIIADTIDNPQTKGIAKLSWEQIIEMHRSGMDFYSHTYDSHAYRPKDAKGKKLVPMLSSPIYLPDKHRLETEKEYEERVYQDLKQANKLIQDEAGCAQ